MDDLVKRLRFGIHTSVDPLALTNEAADEIERLRAALREITKTAPFGQPQEIARAALGEKQDG